MAEAAFFESGERLQHCRRQATRSNGWRRRLIRAVPDRTGDSVGVRRSKSRRDALCWLALQDPGRDAKTIWRYREQLTHAGVLEAPLTGSTPCCATVTISRLGDRSSMRNDGSQLGPVLDPDTASRPVADVAYRSRANLALITLRALEAQFQRP